MITRRIMSLAMAALLLSCPLLDCGGECQSAPAVGASQACCTACQDSDQAPPSLAASCCDAQSEPAPLDGPCPRRCDESACVCKGAIVPADTRCPDRDVESALTCDLLSVGQVEAAQLAARRSLELFPRAHFPPDLSGRDLCTLLGSLLL